MDMGVGTLISVEEYLNTSYSPEVEYRDGVLIDRNVGDKAQAGLQAALAAYLHTRRRQCNICVYIALRIKVRENWYAVPDLCVYQPDFPEESYPERPPVLWVEILSPDDRMADVWNKAAELISHGVPNVWIIDPGTLESELRTSEGVVPVKDRTLRIPGTEIVVPLRDVMEE